jgi:hypothetical protein
MGTKVARNKHNELGLARQALQTRYGSGSSWSRSQSRAARFLVRLSLTLKTGKEIFDGLVGTHLNPVAGWLESLFAGHELPQNLQPDPDGILSFWHLAPKFTILPHREIFGHF